MVKKRSYKRKSPSRHAGPLRLGVTAKGCDGGTYTVTLRKDGTHYWKKKRTVRSAAQKRANLVRLNAARRQKRKGGKQKGRGYLNFKNKSFGNRTRKSMSDEMKLFGGFKGKGLLSWLL